MRISVNLASRPFVELRPFFKRLRIFMAVLALVAIALGVAMHFEYKKLELAQQEMANVHRRTVAAQEEKRLNERRMQQPANAAVLARAHFLNALFLRKSFSWTAVMMDLETVLPTGVQVTAIEPSVTPDGDVIIRLRVSGDRDRAVQLVRNLERSARFLKPRLSTENSKSKEQLALASAGGLPPGGVEFDILANYNPLPVVEEKTAAPGKMTPAAGKTPETKSPTGDPRVKWAKHPPRPASNPGIVLKPFAPAKPSGGTR